MSDQTYFERVHSHTPSPDFENLLAVLNKDVPARPTLFEFFLNGRLYNSLSKITPKPGDDEMVNLEYIVGAFQQAGDDYVTYKPPQFVFPRGVRERAQTISLNDGAVITDRASLDTCPWIEPDECDYSQLDKIRDVLPDGMKVVVNGPGGVLENVIALMGYESLCYAVADDPELARDVFDAVGARLLRHYEIAAPYESVGACISNDDWGFKTQPMLSPDTMREYCFPWHKRFVEVVHAHGKPVILHSCGQPAEIMDDVIEDMKFDGRHSYEDTIQPVEEAYEQYGERIAILGGIDVDFVIRSSPDEVYQRSKAMLRRAEGRGSFALGTGNSVPEYVPDENYCAMTWAALEARV